MACLHGNKTMAVLGYSNHLMSDPNCYVMNIMAAYFRPRVFGVSSFDTHTKFKSRESNNYVHKKIIKYNITIENASLFLHTNGNRI